MTNAGCLMIATWRNTAHHGLACFVAKPLNGMAYSSEEIEKTGPAADRAERLQHLFKEGLLLAPDERAAFLATACPDDPDLRRELESLLAADDQARAGGFMDTPVAQMPTLLGGDNDLEGRRVGAYTILRQLGHGGMGDVYLAVRNEPFKQYVALKIIRRHMSTREVLRRFEMERQILASLNHPNIARLIDGGTTDDGLAYFVMEYVDGMPLTHYCNEHRIGVDERLRLFQTVCRTVHYAHQNLVIHRDLKPSNILVTRDGRIKLLDFGIAKLLNPHLSPVEMPVTRTEIRMMTPEYASPEQVRGEALTTASDVYSLGVVLYELLTDRRPHRLAGRSTEEIFKIISQEEPLLPSTTVTQTTVPVGITQEPPAPIEPSAIARARDLSPERLRRRLRGDLDAITLKALRKETNRRYGSAELLEQDIERHLTRQPVLARRGNRRYRIGKILRRYRVEALAVAVVLVALLGGLGVSLWQAAEARHERDRAEAAQAQAEEVSGFLEGLFAASDPYAPVAERLDTLRVREFLERGAERVQTGLDDQPLVQARMLDVVGRVYRSLGLYADARPLLEQALDIRREALGPRHPDLAESLTNVGVLLLDTGEYERARDLLEEALTINTEVWGDAHPTIAVDLNHLASVLRELGLYEEAEQRHLEALAMMRETADERDPRLTSFMTALVATLEQAGDHETAERYARESLALHRSVYGSDHPQLAIALRELGLILQRRGKYREAEGLFRESLAIAEAVLGQEHPQIADLLNRLASIRYWQKDLAAADSIHRKSIALKRKLYGDMHIEVAYGANNLASVLREKREFDEADAMHREAIAITRAAVGEEHASYWIVLGNRGMTFTARGDCGQAEPLLRAAMAGLRRTIPDDPIRVPWQQRWLGECLINRGRYAEAETTLLESHTALQKARGGDDDFTRTVAGFLVTLYTQWGQPEKAAPYAER